MLNNCVNSEPNTCNTPSLASIIVTNHIAKCTCACASLHSRPSSDTSKSAAMQVISPQQSARTSSQLFHSSQTNLAKQQCVRVTHILVPKGFHCLLVPCFKELSSGYCFECMCLVLGHILYRNNGSNLP